jgi:hypothetical protein
VVDYVPQIENNPELLSADCQIRRKCLGFVNPSELFESFFDLLMFIRLAVNSNFIFLRTL